MSYIEPYRWLNDLRAAIREVTYKDWEFVVDIEKNGAPFLQIQFEDMGHKQYCRKWLLYDTMNPSEAVRTAWLAVQVAEEHEARERFRYKGRRLYAPHFDVDKMAEFSRLKDNLAITDDPKPKL